MENENEKLGSGPAFPIDSSTDAYVFDKARYGISKRFYAACAAMQGMQASMISKESYMAFERGAMDHGCKTVAEYVAKMSFIIADELLKQENE